MNTGGLMYYFFYGKLDVGTGLGQKRGGKYIHVLFGKSENRRAGEKISWPAFGNGEK